MTKKLNGSAFWFHGLFWLVLLFILPTLWHGTTDLSFIAKPLPAQYFMLTNLAHVGLFYGVAYGLFPQLFKPGRRWLYVLSLVALLWGVYGLKMSLLRWWFPTLQLRRETWPVIFFPTLLFLVAGTLYRLGLDYVQNEYERQQQQAERLQSELKFLRSQVNPHFLFNVLNNLVALARKKSNQLEPALIQLSGLMRYMLDEAGNQAVTLDRETTYLADFIDLQRLRFGASVRVTTDIVLPDAPINIEPMLLIPFVENAFKHGTGWINDPFIAIRLWLDEGTMHFTVENRFNPDSVETKDAQSGIGLDNVRKRLQLLYPNRHHLQIKADPPIYVVHLTLQLL